MSSRCYLSGEEFEVDPAGKEPNSSRFTCSAGLFECTDAGAYLRGVIRRPVPPGVLAEIDGRTSRGGGCFNHVSIADPIRIFSITPLMGSQSHHPSPRLSVLTLRCLRQSSSV